MWYLVSQTAIFILIAGLIGFWLGWYLGKLSRQAELDLYEIRLRNCHNERDVDKAQIKSQTLHAQAQSEQLSACEAARKELLAAAPDSSALDDLNEQLLESQSRYRESAEQLIKLTQQNNAQAHELAACKAGQAKPAATAPDSLELTALNSRLADYQRTEVELESRIQHLEHQTLEQAKLLDACEAARVEQTAAMERSQRKLHSAPSIASRGNQPLGLTGVSDDQDPPLRQSAANDAGARPAALLIEPDGAPDNLQRIKGVGPRLETLLHELGVCHFRQIATFSKADIIWINDQLSFKGRIEREKWVEQAQVFLDE